MKKLIFLSAVALWLFAATGCEENENNANEPPKMATPKSIVGTWKCIAFGDDETGEERPIEPKDCDRCYVLTFKKDGSFEGRSFFNSRNGQYNLNGKQLKFTNIGGTKVGEMGDAELFSEALWDISSYKIVGSKLFLYYSNDKYLLFKLKMGCEKEGNENRLKDEAIVIYEGEPALDGCGYFLKIGDSKYKPLSQLPSFCKKGMIVLVDYQFAKGGWRCNWQTKEYKQIKIFNISKK